MKHNWEYKRLGDIAPAMPFKGTITSSDGKYWCLNLDKIESNTGVVLEYDFIEESELGGSVHKFTVDNVLFSKLRPNLNKVVVPEQNGYCTTELVPLHPLDILNRYYLAYYLRSPKYVNFLIGKTGGAKMPRVKMDIFWNSTIPVPPMETQEQIVAELDQINDLIAKNRELLSQLDALALSLFYDTFGDPTSNPFSFTLRRMDEVFLLKAGKAIKASELTETANHDLYPCYGGNGIRGYIAKKSHSGDLCIIGRQGALCGNVSLAKGEFYATEHAVVVTPKSKFSAYWIFYALTALNLNKYAKGVAQPGLSVSIINELIIPVPPLALQEDFSTKVKAIEAQKAKVEAEIAELQTLLDARMDYWFN